VVGGGHSGKTVEGSSALSADFWSIDGLAIGDEGNLFIADAHQGKSFKVDGTSGLVTRVAGPGEQMPVFSLQTPCLWTKLATY